jgi:hypothetical protein
VNENIEAAHAVLLERVNEVIDLIKRDEEKHLVLAHLITARSEDSGNQMLNRLHQMEVSSGVLREIIEGACNFLEQPQHSNLVISGAASAEEPVIRRNSQVHQLFRAVLTSNNGASALNAMRHLDMAAQALRESVLAYLAQHDEREGGKCQCSNCRNARITLANLGRRD